jgi:hypothetical protein
VTLPQVSFSLAIFGAATPIGDKVISTASAARVPPVARIMADERRDVWRFPGTVTADDVRKPLDGSSDASEHGSMDLPVDACYRAFRTRDARFDGRLYSGCRTTGIFCRPICPVRTPRRENMLFYPSAAATLAAGFRPCLRCRPEVAPGIAAWRGTSNTVARALALIDGGALDIASVDGSGRPTRRRRASAAAALRRACRCVAGRRRTDAASAGGDPIVTRDESVDGKRGARSGIPQYQTFQRGLHAVVPPLSCLADIGLKRALARLDGRVRTSRDMLDRAERWRPWRAYAAQHLWSWR